MFDHEIVINEENLKLLIQAEIMNKFKDLLESKDLGYTSWKIAEDVVNKIKELDKSNF